MAGRSVTGDKAPELFLTMADMSWLNPLRERARKLEEETKRIREETQRMQLERSERQGSKAPKFVSITRTIDVTNGTHYLDAIDNKGRHWTAEMSHRVEPWIVYTKTWKIDPQDLH